MKKLVKRQFGSDLLACVSILTAILLHEYLVAAIVVLKLDDIRVGNELTVWPHEICPVDGMVIRGRGVMDEAYLTGEPYEVSKRPARW